MASAPAFCRVALTSKPTADSDIKIEVWLPASGWNGKLQAVGNGGWAGTISYQPLAAAVALGYAAASTDSGHTTPGASFAVGHPEKLVDYAHRSLHELAIHAKAVVGAYYGKEPAASLWNGCSTGGNQGLTLASMYPARLRRDHRGCATGHPIARARRAHGAASIRSPHGRQLHSAREVPCHSRSGDGGVRSEGRSERRHHRKSSVMPFRSEGDPVQRCRRPVVPDRRASRNRARACTRTSSIRRQARCSTLRCCSPDPSCCGECPGRTAAVFQRVRDIQVPCREGCSVGSGSIRSQRPTWRKWTTAAAVLNTAGHNLKPFFARGGKLLMYHGWSDQQNPASTSVSYFGRVVKDAGKSAVGKSIQLYMVPGMTHCQGGVGTDTFDKVAAIEEWMAKGTAPAQIVASHVTDGKVDRTRPLCPYPQVATYKGSWQHGRGLEFCVQNPGMMKRTSRRLRLNLPFCGIAGRRRHHGPAEAGHS